MSGKVSKLSCQIRDDKEKHPNPNSVLLVKCTMPDDRSYTWHICSSDILTWDKISDFTYRLNTDDFPMTVTLIATEEGFMVQFSPTWKPELGYCDLINDLMFSGMVVTNGGCDALRFFLLDKQTPVDNTDFEKKGYCLYVSSDRHHKDYEWKIDVKDYKVGLLYLVRLKA